MSLLSTKYFGPIECDEQSAFHFPAGLPAFEDERSFVPMDLPDHEPLIFLQSMTTPELCFLAFPILVVDPAYHLSLSVEDLATLGLGSEAEPKIGEDLLVLALLCVRDGFPVSANLMAPIVVNLKTATAIQAIRSDSLYSHEHPVGSVAEVGSC